MLMAECCGISCVSPTHTFRGFHLLLPTEMHPDVKEQAIFIIYQLYFPVNLSQNHSHLLFSFHFLVFYIFMTVVV